MRPQALALLGSAIGLPSWQVRWDNQFGLHWNLGPPHMVIREPRESRAKSPKVRALLGRRAIRLHGTHWIQIAAEAWRLALADGTTARRSSSARQCDIASARLSGERLTGLVIDTSTGSTTFYFDLGAVLAVRRPRGWGGEPRGRDDGELWSLMGPGQRHFAVWASGTYIFGSTKKTDPAPRPLSRPRDNLASITIGHVPGSAI